MNISHSALNEHFAMITQELFVALDRTGTVVYINKKGCMLLEDKEKNIIGKNWFDNFYDNTLSDEVKSVFLELISGNMAFKSHYENTILSQTGKVILMSWHNKALYDEQGNITYVLSAGKDITLAKDCESKLIQATLALESALENNNKTENN